MTESERRDTPSREKKRWRAAKTIALFSAGAFGLFLIAGELSLRFFYPQATLYPRWDFSDAYCLILPRDAAMVHARPGEWEYTYTINADRCRGDLVAPDEAQAKNSIVVLGDSYSMGMGVNDGEEYPAVLAEALGADYAVINTGTPGWGLTQQIRRFYEFGLGFEPEWVVLQFSANDPADCMACPVATWEEEGVAFSAHPDERWGLAKILSRSRLFQRSQIYSLLRNTYVARRDAKRVSAATIPATGEDYYITLLEPFAKDLEARGIGFLMIAVNGQLRRFQRLNDTVERLDAEGLLDYVEVLDWSIDSVEYVSPEGHVWNAEAHRIVGKRLADRLRRRGTPPDSL